MISNEDILDNILSEIKGLLVDISGRPDRSFNSEHEVDIFVNEIAKILKDNKGWLFGRMDLR